MDIISLEPSTKGAPRKYRFHDLGKGEHSYEDFDQPGSLAYLKLYGAVMSWNNKTKRLHTMECQFSKGVKVTRIA